VPFEPDGAQALTGAGAGKAKSAHPGAAAALAFDDLVALFQKAFAFAILALLLLLDVGAFIVGHDSLPAMIFYA
jgi:hypothetical protein